MRISRLTVDKLGVKLYDRVSAVIAEIIANAYDADATCVTVEAPMGSFLASKAGGKVTDKGFEIKVVDNGIGMTPEEVQDFFLVVGAERRTDGRRGGKSRKFERKVMGRKGVGKLAPFGICKIIEVVSAGGDFVIDNDAATKGYRTSHIILNYDDIVTLDDEPDDRYSPLPGELDQSLSPEPGTRIILKGFSFRKVPEIDVLGRQLAQRFGIKSQDWEIRLLDNTKHDASAKTVDDFDVETMPNTRIEFKPDGTVIGPDGEPETALTAGFDYDGTFYPLNGWMAYSKAPYSDDLMAGVRIYCRGKIAAQTSVFNQRAGFTGEHNIRSYLVGELHADWLDEDEDLIQTDRRDILWSDELTVAFQSWGQGVVKRIGTLSRDPLRKATLHTFLETGNVEQRVLVAFPRDDYEQIRKRATEVAKMLGRTTSRSEAEDPDVVEELVDLSITLAPHITLDDMMREAADGADSPMSVFGTFLRTARLAELSSFGRIAEDRLKVIDKLEAFKDAKTTDESELQQLISDAPWLVNPEWAPVTENASFSTLRTEFEKYYEENTGQPIHLSEFRETQKRPDFVLSSQEGVVQIIEIKKPGHRLSNNEMDRIVTYYENMEAFLADSGNAEFLRFFDDFHITLVCDNLGLTHTQKAAFDGYVQKDKLTRMNWRSFLLKTREVHKDFLKEAKRQHAQSITARET